MSRDPDSFSYSINDISVSGGAFVLGNRIKLASPVTIPQPHVGLALLHTFCLYSSYLAITAAAGILSGASFAGRPILSSTIIGSLAPTLSVVAWVTIAGLLALITSSLLTLCSRVNVFGMTQRAFYVVHTLWLFILACSIAMS